MNDIGEILGILLPDYGSAFAGDAHDGIIAFFVSLIIAAAAYTLVTTSRYWRQGIVIVNRLHAGGGDDFQECGWRTWLRAHGQRESALGGHRVR